MPIPIRSLPKNPSSAVFAKSSNLSLNFPSDLPPVLKIAIIAPKPLSTSLRPLPRSLKALPRTKKLSANSTQNLFLARKDAISPIVLKNAKDNSIIADRPSLKLPPFVFAHSSIIGRTSLFIYAANS